VFELVLGAGQRRAQACAVNDVRVLVAGEAALARDWESLELAAEQVASLSQRAGPRVEGVEVLDLGGGQCCELRA
jgi:hypothetical protein